MDRVDGLGFLLVSFFFHDHFYHLYHDKLLPFHYILYIINAIGMAVAMYHLRSYNFIPQFCYDLRPKR